MFLCIDFLHRVFHSSNFLLFFLFSWHIDQGFRDFHVIFNRINYYLKNDVIKYMYIKSTSIIAIEGVICCQCSDSIEYCKSEDKGEYFFYVGT